MAARSDLPVRFASALVMLAVAGGAFWFGGMVLTALIGAIGLAVVIEWALLIRAFEPRLAARAVWGLAAAGYVGLACRTALVRLAPAFGFWPLPWVIASVIAVDVGAYFAGRRFGGPKIAPAISPSKTWSGLGGAIVGASLVYLAMAWFDYRAEAAEMRDFVAANGAPDTWDSQPLRWGFALLFGAVTAIVAQAGDFFESWLKRRAGVKDSGRLIPGHGGVFDRVDGLLAVLFVLGILSALPVLKR